MAAQEGSPTSRRNRRNRDPPRSPGGAAQRGRPRRTGSDGPPRRRRPRRRRRAAARSRAERGVEDDGPPAPAGSTSLVIVESPAKAKTIGKYLGRGYRVQATVGHIADLPEKKLGIDIDKGFEPEYVTDLRARRRRSPS